MTNTNQAITVVQPDEISALSRWDALAFDIANATEESKYKAFDYEDKNGNKLARSYLASLRRLNGRIERARKEAKAIHLERGRAVDETARLLEASVQSLIEPHETAIKAIEAKEIARIECHRAVLNRIAALPCGVSTSDEARARLVELEGLPVDGLEEFSAAGTARKAEAQEQLEALLATLLMQEAERAELEALRAEKARREEEQRRAEIRQQLLSEQAALSVLPDPVLTSPLQPQQEAHVAPAVVDRSKHGLDREQLLRQLLLTAIANKTRGEIVSMIIDGTLHPAVCVNWHAVKESEPEIDW